MPDRLEAHGDPWAAINAAPQSLEPLLAMHERDMARRGLHGRAVAARLSEDARRAAARRAEPCAKGSRVTTVDELLLAARRGLRRLTPEQVAVAQDVVLIDIRGERQREADGEILGAIRISRNVLEWRCDPACEHRDPRVSDPLTTQVIVCHEGYQSSLAAAMLQTLGLPHATDMAGGFIAWRDAGLPIE